MHCLAFRCLSLPLQLKAGYIYPTRKACLIHFASPAVIMRCCGLYHVVLCYWVAILRPPFMLFLAKNPTEVWFLASIWPLSNSEADVPRLVAISGLTIYLFTRSLFR